MAVSLTQLSFQHNSSSLCFAIAIGVDPEAQEVNLPETHWILSRVDSCASCVTLLISFVCVMIHILDLVVVVDHGGFIVFTFTSWLPLHVSMCLHISL